VGVVRGRWAFAGRAAPPSSATIATELATATGLAVVNHDAREERDERIDVATINEALFDMERDTAAATLTLSSFIPAHPYLWENLDRVLTGLGGCIDSGGSLWRPSPRLRDLRRPWDSLTPRQRFLLRVPTIGGSRWLDRFI
jgi:hypothetical protein